MPTDEIEKNIEQQAAIFSALGDPTRLRLVKLLCYQSAPGALCVNALATLLNVTQSAVSQHLRVLKGIGLVKGKRRGYYVHYRINHEVIDRCRQLVLAALMVQKSETGEQPSNVHCPVRDEK